MDQIKPALEQLKKHHFWVLNGLVLVLALVGSIISGSAMAARFEKDRTTIDAQVKSLETARPEDITNEKCREEVAKLEKSLQNKLVELWKFSYDSQRETMRWPVQVRAEIEKLPYDAEIGTDIRIQYDKFVIEPEFDRIFESVANVRRPRGDAKKAAGSKSGPEPTVEGIVEWDQAARDSMKKRYRAPEASTLPSVKVRWTQEDLWVIESLASVIGALNRDATDPYNAVVKKIEHLDVAQWAIAAAQSEKLAITGAEATAGAGAMGGMAGGAGMKSQPGGVGGGMSNMKKQGGQEGGSIGESKDELNVWLAGRYLDEKGEPLKAESPQPFNEFKQVFVRVKVVMAEKDIPELLAGYINHSSMPMDVRRVLVRYGNEAERTAESAATGGGGAGAGGGMAASAPTGGGPAGGGGPPASGGGGAAGKAGGAAGGAAGGGAKEAGSPDEVSVEICGVVRLYLPPVADKIGGGSAGKGGLARNLGIPKTPAAPPAGASGGGGGAMMGGGK